MGWCVDRYVGVAVVGSHVGGWDFGRATGRRVGRLVDGCVGGAVDAYLSVGGIVGSNDTGSNVRRFVGIFVGCNVDMND